MGIAFLSHLVSNAVIVGSCVVLYGIGLDFTVSQSTVFLTVGPILCCSEHICISTVFCSIAALAFVS